MSVELIKDLLKIDQTIGKDQIQALVEGEILLPSDKPKMNKILTIDGDTKITGTRTAQDKIIVNGIVNFRVLYSAEDENQPVHSINATTDFEEEIELKGVEEDAVIEAKAYVEHIDYSMTEGNKISVKTVLGIEQKAQVGNSIDIVKDIKGAEGLQILKESIKYDDIVGTNTASTMIKEAFEIDDDMPDIVDILKVDLKPYEKEISIVEGKVIVSGVVECSIMYFGGDEENRINHLRHEMPFTHFVEVPSAAKNMQYGVKLEAGDVSYDTRGDINGDLRIIDVEAIINVAAKVYQQREKEVTVDTYSTKKKFNVKKQKVDITENVGRNVSKEIVKGIIDVSLEEEDIRNIYNLNVKPILSDYRLIEGKVVIEGFLDVDMLYQGDASGDIKDVRDEIPFKSYVDIEGIEEGMDCDIEVLLDDIHYNKVNGQKVEVETIVKTDILVNRVKKISIVTEAEELPEEIDPSKRPSITIYIVQKEDSLWDIAKRYNTTVDELIRTNDIINPDNIMPGEKIIVEKNLEFQI